MTCCQPSTSQSICENEDYVDVEDFYYKSGENITSNECIVDCRLIIANIPESIFNISSFTVNVFSNEEILLEPCEAVFIKTNIFLKPYLPITCSVVFQGLLNGISVKSCNQVLIPIKEETLSVRVQNFNKSRQTLPKGMPLGKIIITSKNYWEL